jgi:hypothetical protein
LSIRPERIEASRERKNPYFFSEKTRAARTITKENKERKGETAKNAGKMRFF